MMTLHHLNDSRSQKIVWLLEELGTPYELVPHQRHPETLSAPAAMKARHPIGKAPILEDQGRAIVESGAIVDYILRRHAQGALQPAGDGPELMAYLEWLYFAVSIGTNPVMLKVYSRYYAMAGGPIDAAADAEFALVLGYLDRALAGRTYLLGDLFTAADIQMSFVAELARSLIPIDSYPHIVGWLARLHARPAFRASLARPGSYIYAT